MRERINLTGKQVGRLLVLEEDFDYVNEHHLKNKSIRYWKCQCFCDNKTIKTIAQSRLTSASPTQSCGCLLSKGESNISKLLEDNKILYEKEKIFTDLIAPSNHKYRYDFYLPDYHRLIEYDGEQHYSYTGNGWNAKENFEKTQKV